MDIASKPHHRITRGHFFVVFSAAFLIAYTFLSNVRCCMICHVRQLACSLCFKGKERQGGLYDNRTSISCCSLYDSMAVNKEKVPADWIVSLFSCMQDPADTSRRHRMKLVDSKIIIHNGIMPNRGNLNKHRCSKL